MPLDLASDWLLPLPPPPLLLLVLLRLALLLRFDGGGLPLFFSDRREAGALATALCLALALGSVGELEPRCKATDQ